MSETAPKTPKQTERIKHQRALADYLALGPGRSIEKLHRRYIENAPKPPCLRSLKGWSTRYGWKAKAVEYDERVATQVAERAETAAVEQGFDHVKALTKVADKALRKVIAGLDAEEIEAGDAYQMAALVNSALGAIKGVQLLTGGATERFGAEAVKDHAPEWMQDKLTAPAPPPAAPTTSGEAEVPEGATRH